ncbi:MAG: hypothetical protein IIZ12_03030 [Eggerthellaceae bacterium]|nr:hypothetical protein [Eggerthellaceae bacterium]
MTDNRTTELRANLTERGVEYEADDHKNYAYTYWGDWAYCEPLDAKPGTLGAQCELMLIPATPEQAIAATLGNERAMHGTLTAEQVERIVYRNCEWYEGGEIDAQAIADELNAELGSGTCKWTWVEEWTDTDAGRECDYAHWTLDCGCWDVYDEHFQDFDDYESKPKGIGFCERCGKAVER